MARILANARTRLARQTDRFARAEQGATAVEFALVALPFLMLVFAILELGMVFMVSLTLETAVADVGRSIRTGEVQTGSGNATTFKAAVCKKLSWLGSKCDGALQIDVSTFASFAAAKTATSDPKKLPPMGWDPGLPGSIVLVRAYYTWPLITPLLNTGIGSANGKRVIYAATAFSNEPYE